MTDAEARFFNLLIDLNTAVQNTHESPIPWQRLSEWADIADEIARLCRFMSPVAPKKQAAQEQPK